MTVFVSLDVCLFVCLFVCFLTETFILIVNTPGMYNTYFKCCFSLLSLVCQGPGLPMPAVCHFSMYLTHNSLPVLPSYDILCMILPKGNFK